MDNEPQLPIASVLHLIRSEFDGLRNELRGLIRTEVRKALEDSGLTAGQPSTVPEMSVPSIVTEPKGSRGYSIQQFRQHCGFTQEEYNIRQLTVKHFASSMPNIAEHLSLKQQEAPAVDELCRNVSSIAALRSLCLLTKYHPPAWPVRFSLDKMLHHRRSAETRKRKTAEKKMDLEPSRAGRDLTRHASSSSVPDESGVAEGIDTGRQSAERMDDDCSVDLTGDADDLGKAMGIPETPRTHPSISHAADVQVVERGVEYENLENDEPGLVCLYIPENETVYQFGSAKVARLDGTWHPTNNIVAKGVVEEVDRVLHGHKAPTGYRIVELLSLSDHANMEHIRVPCSETYRSGVVDEVTGPLVEKFKSGVRRFFWPQNMIWQRNASGGIVAMQFNRDDTQTKRSRARKKARA